MAGSSQKHSGFLASGIRYGAARGWVDAVIQPHETRGVLAHLLDWTTRPTPQGAKSHPGVMQV